MSSPSRPSRLSRPSHPSHAPRALPSADPTRPSLFFPLLAVLALTVPVLLFFPDQAASMLGADQTHYLSLAKAFFSGQIGIASGSGLSELISAISGAIDYVVYPPAPALLALPLVLLDLPARLANDLLGALTLLAAMALALAYAARLGLGQRGLWLLAVALAGGSGLWVLAAIPGPWFVAGLSSLAFGFAALLAAPRYPALAGALAVLALASRIPTGLGIGVLLLARLAGLPPLADPGSPRQSWRGALRLALRAALGALPVLALLFLYNTARFGSPLDSGYAHIPGVLSEPWYQDGLISLAYLPRGLEALLLRGPGWLGGLPVPDIGGMSPFIVAPIALVPLLAPRAFRPSLGIAAIVIAIAASLGLGMVHGAWGFVQFGYRFAYDALPAAITLAVVAAPHFRHGPRRRLLLLLLALGLLVNLWGWLAIGAEHWTFRGL